MTLQKAISKSPIKVDNILKGFTTEEREALDEYYKNKFKLPGRSTSSKKLGIISDMHVGSTTALYSGYGPVKISKDQQKLLDWWTHCADTIGKCDLLLLNGEPIDGENRKSMGAERWTADLNEQISDAEHLISMWKYDKILLTRGSQYHTQHNHTNLEETLARRLNNVLPYSGLFNNGLNLLRKQKGFFCGNDNGHAYGGRRYYGKYVNEYVFFDINSRLFNAIHSIGFNRWKIL